MKIKFRKGCPLPSHEYLSKCLNTAYFEGRGFLVGTHLDNVSTFFDHPFAGKEVSQEILANFGIDGVEKLIIPYSFRKVLFNKLPHQFKRKLRYWAGEKKWILRPIFAIMYNTLRG